ncbi:MAG: AEC family transporter [Clostridia bacterium]|nr:AEC family transporter [Clostridia bacterium]
MIETFLTALNPMLSLFSFIAIGYLLKKSGILPDGSETVLAKLETYVFFPALSFITLAENCTPENLSTHFINIALAIAATLIAIGISLSLSGLFVKERGMERGVYKYALAFANSGYVGNPLVHGMYGDLMLSYYSIYCLPVSVGIYTWGLNTMIPANTKSKNVILKILNPPIVGLLAGMAAGLSGLNNYIPDFAVTTLEQLKGCMGPCAMLLAGITVASYPFKDMISDKKVYIASLLRLTLIPAVIIGCLFGIKELINLIFGLEINNTVLHLCFFSTAAPLGLNTVVFPAAYGGNPKTGASMAMISHTLCVITIPLMYALLTLIFGSPIII